MATMRAPSMALLRALSPAIRSESLPWTARGCLAQRAQQQTANFSSTEQRQARKKRGPKKDPKITQIRYHLFHPLTPRPLRLSRNRYLRHWTIHRAWQRYLDQQRLDREMQLERQYNSMAGACEALRLMDKNGFTEEERRKLGVPEAHGSKRDEGRLYRIAMLKQNVWDNIPIESARMQTETPAREPWNHGWKR